MIADRMGGQVDSGSSELLTEEFKRIKGKTGKITVNKQKIKADTFVAKKKEPSSAARVVTPIPLLPEEVEKDIKPERQSVDKTLALIASKLNIVSNNVQQTTENIQKKDTIETKQDKQERIDTEITANKERENPEYIQLDDKNKTVKLIRIPKFSEVPYPVIMEPNLVIEYYSR